MSHEPSDGMRATAVAWSHSANVEALTERPLPTPHRADGSQLLGHGVRRDADHHSSSERRADECQHQHQQSMMAVQPHRGRRLDRQLHQHHRQRRFNQRRDGQHGYGEPDGGQASDDHQGFGAATLPLNGTTTLTLTISQ